MKKESKNYKAPNSVFILVAIFILLMANRTFAQCVDSDPGSSCHTNINFDPACYAVYGGGSDITDLKASGFKQVYSVLIKGNDDPNIATMTITDIFVRNAACGAPDGPFIAGTFPAVSGLTFQNSSSGVISVKILVTNPPPGTGINYAVLPIGSHIDFIVNAFNGSSTLIAKRRYTFTIVADSYILGDPHLTTVDGGHYDFQSAGEFVALRADSGDNFEIQTRQTAVATNGPGTDPYTGISTCVSLNTAVAVRVGKHRVSYEPNIKGIPDSSGLQLRVDGALTELGESGLDLGSGGRVMKSSAAPGAIEIEFPDGASLIVTPNWWSAYNQWYLNLSIYNTAARKGISGVIATNNAVPAGIAISHIPARSWLPALPDGSSLGPMPRSLHDRFVTLYKTFADAWRVTDQTSLFDYAPGTSTATFTNKNWPSENAQSCLVTGQTPLPPIALQVAQELCSDIVDSNMRANAIFDVMVTGEATFAKAYLVTQQIRTGTTATMVSVNKDTTKYGDSATITATVIRKFSADKSLLTGSVEFTADGEKLGQVKLEADGSAILTTTSLKVGGHKIVATFIPDSGSKVFSSSSPGITHTVVDGNGGNEIWKQWWFWLLVIIALIIIYRLAGKKKGP